MQNRHPREAPTVDAQWPTVIATRSARQSPPQFVQSATFNGKPLLGTHLRATDIHRGGRLHLQLGPEPSPWGRGIRPPSLSDSRAAP